MATEEKGQVNMRLTPTAKKILVMLSDIYGTAQGDVVELLLRVEAARLQLPGHEKSPLRHGMPTPVAEPLLDGTPNCMRPALEVILRVTHCPLMT